MSKHKSAKISGITGLSVLAMFTVAIVAGQSRAGPGIEDPGQLSHHREIGLVFTLGKDDIKRFGALPAIVETLFQLPIRIEVDTTTNRVRLSPNSASNDAPQTGRQ